MITGIDISAKNGTVNLEKIDEVNVRFLYIKASEALNSKDRCFEQNKAKAIKNGLIHGAYHWLHPRLHVGQQAKFFVDTVGDFTGMLPPAICLQTHRAPMEEIGKNIKIFLGIMEDMVGVKPVIYTSSGYWQKYLAKSEWACEYPLWLDHPGSNWPPQIFPWAGWTFWQFAYQAKLPEIPADIGLNWFIGDHKDLQNMVIQ